MRNFLIAILFLFVGEKLLAQKDVTTVGLQFKPIISANYLNTSAESQVLSDVKFTIDPQIGYSFGMLVRRGFTKQISFESGINYTRRNYNLIIEDPEMDFKGVSDFKYIIYEIPLLGLVYIQLSDKLYMNAALGGAINFLPTDWQSYDDYFIHRSWRNSWVLPSLLANLGFEYRTYNKGYFYLGASFNRPFVNITQAVIQYNNFGARIEPGKDKLGFDINGNYLTIDLRYFFHEKAERRR